MISTEEQELKKEFQLERVILFSDAVFAIIITIMVIDLKIPEDLREAGKVNELHHAFKELILKFIGYALTFFLVARFWVSHLKIFSFLKDYNIKLLVLNLLFLFFVSLFPFAVTLITGSTRPGSAEYGWGIDIYLIVFFSSQLAQSFLIRYLIKNKSSLCYRTESIEVVLKWRMVKIIMTIIPILVVVLLICNYYIDNPLYSMYIVAFFGIGSSRIAKKIYPPVIGENDNKPYILRMFTSRKKKNLQESLPHAE